MRTKSYCSPSNKDNWLGCEIGAYRAFGIRPQPSSWREVLASAAPGLCWCALGAGVLLKVLGGLL